MVLFLIMARFYFALWVLAQFFVVEPGSLAVVAIELVDLQA